MSKPVSMNQQLACEPFPHKSVTTRNVGGLVLPEQKHILVGLKVVFGGWTENGFISEGQTAYVRADRYATPWGKGEFEAMGRKFIMVPISEVVLVDGEEATA